MRIDRTPPPSPENIAVSPTGWATTNRFTLSWENPVGFNVAGAYYAHQEPSGPEDGTFIVGSDQCLSDCQTEINVPGEGVWDLYLWLKDSAGNTGWEAPNFIQGAFRYDVTPPTVSHHLQGTLGRDNWWVSPVTVGLAAQDAVTQAPTLFYRLRQPPDFTWGPWQTYASHIQLIQQGTTSVRYYARDEAGNEGNIQEFSVKMDTRAPKANILPLQAETSAPTPNVRFNVNWAGDDPTPGSGIAGFGVEYRNGIGSNWASWLSGTQIQTAPFDGLPGHVYYFRAQARDVAGNVGPLSGMGPYGDQRTYVQSVVNGYFETPALVGWEGGGVLWARSVPAPSRDAVVRPMALLGRPELGRGYDDQNNPTVPVGYGAITQTITIPPLADLANPRLTFWYQVYSYDVVLGSDGVTLFDSLDVHILDLNDQELALVVRDGDYGTWPKSVPLGTTGWKLASFSLVPYAGQTIQIRFQVWNRNDNPQFHNKLAYYNTWAYVDEIKVIGELPGHALHLPAILKNR